MTEEREMTALMTSVGAEVGQSPIKKHYNHRLVTFK